MHHHSRPLSRSALAALLLGLLGSTLAFAQEVSISGDVYPGSATSPNWDVGGELFVGDIGTGSMVINTGGSVSSAHSRIGNDSESNGTVTVSGGSWTISAELYVGDLGTGTLTLTGGSVSTTDTAIGFGDDSTGTVTVSGGSWTNSGALYVGFQGTGTLNLNGGVVTATQLRKDSGGGSTTGTVTFNGGTLRLNANQANPFDGFEAGNITLAAGGGTLDTQGYTVATAYALSGAGGLTKTGSGTLTLSAANTFAGATTVSAGTLLLHNLSGSGTGLGEVTVQSGAFLGGDGSIAGDVTFATGAGFAFDPTQTLTVTGNVTVGDAATFGVDDLFGLSSSTAFGTYTLIDGTSTDFSTLGLANWGTANAYDLGNGVSAYFQSGSLQLVVAATAVPEPSTYAAIFGALALGFVAYRKRSSRRSA